ncbi:hypothetical protein HAX54_030440 [Datura stramonium]|uniref:SKP1 component dimerisation domain-containing protein n=1 Tax=Datura stramonium TaxID=4076 RepID=A0ABS8SB13_DATST|nr:hypothetical protein [Datura stramonium]
MSSAKLLTLKTSDGEQNNDQSDETLGEGRCLERSVDGFRQGLFEGAPPYDLLLVANYLNDKELVDAICQEVAYRIKEKTAEEIRKKFNIKNDFTQEEEEQIRKENAWAFE